MILYAQAIDILRIAGCERKKQIAIETIPLGEVEGRICAADVVSSDELPAFANSAMDGFAVRSKETLRAGVFLRAVNLVAAGDGKQVVETEPNVCIEIMTGARVPEGFDAIVRVEDTESRIEPSGERMVRLSKAIDAGENLRSAGEDYGHGESVIRVGERVTAAHVMACAALGISRLQVLRKIRIGVVSTGRELVSHETVPVDAQIRNATLPYLLVRLEALGVDVVQLGTIPDQPDEYQAIITQPRIRDFDVIISTGAVSVGKFDFVSNVLERIGASIHFHKVAIRPGKPVLFAELAQNGPAFFGVPGNPVSTSVGLRFFIEPFLRALQGLPPEQTVKLRLRNDFKKPEGLRCFFKARLAPSGNDVTELEILKGQASFMIKPLTRATMWAILAEEGQSVRARDLVEAVPVDMSFGE